MNHSKTSEVHVAINQTWIESGQYQIDYDDEFALLPVTFCFDQMAFSTEFMAKQIDYQAALEWANQSEIKEHKILLIDGIFDFDFERIESDAIALHFDVYQGASHTFELPLAVYQSLISQMKNLIGQ
jgi:hypothetical protein